MKRGALIYVHVLILCMVLIVTGCAKNNRDVGDESGADFEQTIRAKFADAEEAFSWFTGCGEIGMDYKDQVECNLGYYARVTQYDICSIQDLSNYLSQYFESTLCNELLNHSVQKDVPLFREIDGILYCFAGYVGQLSYKSGDKSISIDGTKQDDRITVQIHYIVEFYGKTREVDIDYIMVKGDDDIWRFENDFMLPIEVAAEL